MPQIDVEHMHREMARINDAATEVLTADTGELIDYLRDNADRLEDIFQDKKVTRAIVTHGSLDGEVLQAALHGRDLATHVRVYGLVSEKMQELHGQLGQRAEMFTKSFGAYRDSLLYQQGVTVQPKEIRRTT